MTALRARHLGEAGVLAVLFERADADQVAAFHAEMVMHGRQAAALARLDDLEAGAEPRRVGGAQPIHVDADPVADPAGAAAPVSQVTVIDWSAWPGMIQAGICTERPR